MSAAVQEHTGRLMQGAQPWRRRERLIPLGLAVAALALAFAQRPGLDTADTKVNVHVGPFRFLGELLSVWSPTASLGHVQGGQYSGYLWPMGPFFAVGHVIGLGGWVTERLWLAALFGLAAWGAVRLADELLDRRRGVAHLVAGAAYLANPYVVVFTNRTSIFLLAYAALPWLMVVVHRGVRRPRNWWWPAAFALITTSTGGGVNATVTALVMLGPLLLLLYEVLLGDVTARDGWAFAWRTVLATGAASVWWVAPLLVQSRYGLNFLQFTEQVGAIWGTTSLTESLRLMSYWPSYLGVGYGDRLVPYFGDSPTMLFDVPVVVAGLLAPALALGGYAWTRRRRYGPLLLGTAIVALLVMSVGYPTGTLLRSGVTFIYNRVAAIQFLRTTYKAGPVLALAAALLLGAAAAVAWDRWRGVAVRTTVLGVLAAVIVVGSLPLFDGHALELTYKRVPPAWRQAASGLDRTLPANSRALVLPGQAYAFYRWGGTVDPLLPALTDEPVAVRNTPPYDDLHAVDLLWTVDDLVQQQRLLPGELAPLLKLMNVRAVISATDDDTERSGAIAPQAAAQTLARQAGLGAPADAYGPARSFASPAQTADPSSRLPEVRRYDTAAPGLVRVQPASEPTVVDGSASGLADIAALGRLSTTQPLFYAGDESAATIRAQAVAGATVEITDSDRRQAFTASTIRQNRGAVEPADQGFSADAAVLDPFPLRGPAGQTVQVLEGARSITAPYNPELPQFPAQRPYAAFDGDPHTAWQADPTLDPSRHWIQITFDAPRDIGSIDLVPDASDPGARLTRVQIAGRTFAVHPGDNHLALGLRHAGSLRILLSHVATRGRTSASAGGLAEVRIPGVHVRELLRPPTLAESALRGASLSHTALDYVFERATADDPLQRGPAPAQAVARGDRLQAAAALVRQAQDPESEINRLIDPPAARRWVMTGRATVSPDASDAAVDTLARTTTPGTSFTSSGRLEGLPDYRASRAFDGAAATAWIGPYGPYQPAWLQWRSAHTTVLRSLRLSRTDRPVQFPTRVTLTSLSSGTSETATVRSDGSVTLSRPLRGKGFRIAVLGATGSTRAAVGIAGITGAGVPRARAGASGSGASGSGASVAGRCSDVTAVVGGHRIALRLSGSIASLDGGEPLRLTACGAPVALPASPTSVSVPAGITRPLIVSLRSPAPQPLDSAAAATVAGAVTDSGTLHDSSVSSVRVHVTAPGWLVLGESFNRGWQATCDGHSLGAPRVIDGFANGWPIRPGCTRVAMTFGPQRDVDVGFIIGALACAVLLLVLALARPGPPPGAETIRDLQPPERFARYSAGRAIAAGVAIAAIAGFVFALRAGIVIGPAFALVLWRGLPVRWAALAAGALLVVVIPLLYIFFPGLNQGGYDVGYVNQHLGAHWVAVAAVTLLVAALLRDLSAGRASL